MTASSTLDRPPYAAYSFPAFGSELGASTYSAFFGAAITAEAKALQQECNEHDLYKVQLSENKHDTRQSMYQLHVPGLREFSTLQIDVGDVVQIRSLRLDKYGILVPHASLRDTTGQILPYALPKRNDAVVWNIDRLREMISLRVDSLNRSGPLFNVRFTMQSDRIDALQRAVNAAQQLINANGNDWMRSMLFPEPSDGVLQRTLNTGKINVSLRDPLLNYEQARATATILQANWGRVPYLISGPPGTGKTKTVVELALQMLSKDSTSRLLLCSPSESASDLLVHRLSKFLRPSELFRLNSPSRAFPEVPDSILQYCFVDGTIFSLPPFPDLMKRRVVVVTCRDAEILQRARLTNRDLFELEQNMHEVLHSESKPIVPALHWTSLIIDEAAQATEPEALISLLVVAPPAACNYPDTITLPTVCLVGDQNQLGPRTASKAAVQISFFERLMSRPLYRDHPLARRSQSGGIMQRLTQEMLPIIRPPFTDLIRNYRSHPGILAIPSSLFYNDTLEPSAENVHSLLTWSGFQGRSNMPVLFVTNRSPDEIEQLNGGGWYNIGEARQALQCARSFLEEGLLQQHEICIMSPFRAQVRMLRLQARDPSMRMNGVNIGPLEAYQGLEFKLVIVCTTRTRDRFIDQDLARGLGVIHEPRRFNVALTRAMQGLIVIGNPSVLSQDENWASFMAFCRRNGAWERRDGDEWHTPHGRKIQIPRLEKQLLMRIRVAEEREKDLNGLNGSVRTLGLIVSEDEAHYETGVAAEEFVRGENERNESDEHGLVRFEDRVQSVQSGIYEDHWP